MYNAAATDRGVRLVGEPQHREARMAAGETYLITKAQVQGAFGMADAVRCVEDAFRLYGEGQAQMPPKVYLTFEKGDLRCMPVYMPALKMAGVKNVNVHPGNKDMPAVMAVISLVDPDTGFPLALMDGTHVTSLRTGAAAAVAAKYLAREDAQTAAFIGAGGQARTQLEGLLIVRPGLSKIIAFDLDADRARGFCDWCRKTGAPDARPAASLQEAITQADILVTITPSRKPIVQDAWVKPGTHINAIGADAEGKEELEPAILKRARVVIDNWEQASHSGEINVPLAHGLLAREDLAGDVGQLVTGQIEGRRSPDDVTVFDSTGLAVQDIACAAEIWHRLGGDEAQRSKLQSVRFF